MGEGAFRRFLPRLWRPEVFQGSLKREPYFEGWYVKVVTRDRSRSVGFIPGVSLPRGGFAAGGGEDEPHGFVQLNDSSAPAGYKRFSLGECRFSRRRFEAVLGPNRFSREGMSLDLETPAGSCRGSLRWKGWSPYPVRPWSPGIMGPYAFIPGMECFHGMVSLDHGVEGELEMGGERVDFTGGRGYIEKDWGRSMPRSWVWIQGNHFSVPGVSFFFSLAHVPWRKRWFPGFLAVLKFPSGGGGSEMLTWASYNGSRLTEAAAGSRGFRAELSRRSHRLILQARLPGGNGGADLKAPVGGRMDRTIRESLRAEVSLRLLGKQGEILLETGGDTAGMEMTGTLNELLGALGRASEQGPD